MGMCMTYNDWYCIIIIMMNQRRVRIKFEFTSFQLGIRGEFPFPYNDIWTVQEDNWSIICEGIMAATSWLKYGQRFKLVVFLHRTYMYLAQFWLHFKCFEHTEPTDGQWRSKLCHSQQRIALQLILATKMKMMIAADLHLKNINMVQTHLYCTATFQVDVGKVFDHQKIFLVGFCFKCPILNYV